MKKHRILCVLLVPLLLNVFISDADAVASKVSSQWTRTNNCTTNYTYKQTHALALGNQSKKTMKLDTAFYKRCLTGLNAK